MKFLLLIALIGIDCINCNLLKNSFAQNKDIDDELDNLEYSQSRQESADERDPALWELWDRQNGDSEIKNPENSDSFEDYQTNDDNAKPIQGAVKRESVPSSDKHHPLLQLEPLLSDANRNRYNKREDVLLSRVISNINDNGSNDNGNGGTGNAKKSGATRSTAHPCKTHSTRSCSTRTKSHRSTCPTHRSTQHRDRTTNCSHAHTTTTESTETILVQEPFKLDSNEVYSVCDMDGNWSWPLSNNESKKWLKYMWIFPCLLLVVLLFLLFVRTCQDYAERRTASRCSGGAGGGGGGGGGGGNDPKCRNKMCPQLYQDPCRDPRMNASSPLIRKLEPRRYQSPGPGCGSVASASQQMMRQHRSNQGQQNQQPLQQMSSRMTQVPSPQQMKGGPPSEMMQMQRKQSLSMSHHTSQGPPSPACPPTLQSMGQFIQQGPGPRAPRMAPSASTGMARMGGKTQKLVFIRSPQPFAMPRKGSCPCPRPQPYFPTPPPGQQPSLQQTHLQQQCLPMQQQQQQQQQQHQQQMQQQQMMSGYSESRQPMGSSYNGFCPPSPPRKMRGNSPPSQSPPRGECESRSPSPPPAQKQSP